MRWLCRRANTMLVMWLRHTTHTLFLQWLAGENKPLTNTQTPHRETNASQMKREKVGL